MTWTRGAGSLRQRWPGVWEIRVALGPDLVSGRSAVRSLTVHGDRAAAEDARARWTAQAALVRSQRRSWPGISLEDLLVTWLVAEHGWRPSTLAGYRSTVGILVHDPLGSRRAVDVSPAVLRAEVAAWRRAGCGDPTVSARVRVLRSALGLLPRRLHYPADLRSRPPLTDAEAADTIDRLNRTWTPTNVAARRRELRRSDGPPSCAGSCQRQVRQGRGRRCRTYCTY